MPAPLVAILPTSPARLYRPDDFINESVVFLDALPTFRTQVNQLSEHINNIILNKWDYGSIVKQASFPSISQYQGGVIPQETATVEYVAALDSFYEETTKYSSKLNSVGTYTDMLFNYIGVVPYDNDKPTITDVTPPHTRVMSEVVFNQNAELFTASLIANINSLYQSTWYNYTITFVGDNYGLITDSDITHSDDYGLVTDTNILY